MYVGTYAIITPSRTVSACIETCFACSQHLIPWPTFANSYSKHLLRTMEMPPLTNAAERPPVPETMSCAVCGEDVKYDEPEISKQTKCWQITCSSGKSWHRAWWCRAPGSNEAEWVLRDSGRRGLNDRDTNPK